MADPVTIGAVASGLLTATSNALSHKSQRDYDRRMIAEERAYNSPSAQVKRLRSAGINPALALTNGMMSSGNVDQSAGGQQPATYDFSPIAQGMRDSVDLYQQKRVQDAQIDSIQASTNNQMIKNRFELSRQVAELANMIADYKKKGKDTDYLEIQMESAKKELSWIDKRNSSMIAKNDADAAQATANAAYTNTLRAYQQIVNRYAPQMQKALLSQLQAHTSELLSAAALHGADAAHKYALKFLTDAQRRGVNIDNQEKPRLAKAIADAAVHEADKAKAEANIATRGARDGTLWTKFLGSHQDENLINSILENGGQVP